MALTRITKGVIKPNENYDTHNINSTGIVTAIGLDVNGNGDISGNLNVGGVLTYEDVTSIDAVGLVTAREGIFLPDSKTIKIGNTAASPDFTIQHNGTNSIINNTTGALLFQNNGSSSMYIASDGQVSLNNDITFIGASANALWDKSENYFSIPDKIVHTGDTDTAIRFPGTDIFAIETGGSERFRIGSNALITTTQPNSAIGLIVKNSAHDSQLQILATASNKNSVIFFGDAADDDIGQIDYDHNNNSLAVTVNTSEALRITSGGLVGINTDSPGTNHILEILGNASAYATLNVKSQSLSHGSALELGAVDDDDYGSIYQFASGSGEGGRMRFTAGGIETMNLRGGKVGVGIENPSNPLHVVGADPQIKIQDSANNSHAQIFLDGANSNLNFDWVSGSQRNINLINSGNGAIRVGIGSTIPTETLDVDGTVKATSFEGGLPITNGADNRIVTCTSASAIRGETGLTYNGSTFGVAAHTLNFTQSGNVTTDMHATGGDAKIILDNSGDGNYSGIDFVRERSSGAGVNGGSIFMESDTSSNDAYLYLQAQSASASAPITSALSDNNGVRLILKGGDGIFSVECGSTEKLRITSGGGVYIGNTGNSYNSVLGVHKAASNAQSFIVITNNTTGTTTNDGFVIGYNGAQEALLFNKESTPMRFATAATERLRIGSMGGHKITCDESHFSANLSEMNTGNLALNINKTRQGQTKGIGFGAIGNSNSNTGIQCYDTSDNSANPLLINPFGGNVSINTTNTSEGVLQVNGDITAKIRHGSSDMYGMLAGRKFDGNSALGGYAIRYASGYESPWIVGYNAGSSYNNQITFGSMTTSDRSLATGVQKRMVIDMASGKVGINNSNPDDTLDVDGTAQVTGNVYFGSDIYMYGNSYSGKGVFLGGSSNDHKLDYYEEGTYVPTTNTGLSLVSSYDLFTYIRIGRCCTVRGLFYPNNNPSGSGHMTISLPFASYNYSQIAGAGGSDCMHRLVNGANNGVAVYLQDNSSFATFYKNGGSGNWTAVINSDWNAAMEIYVDFTYFTVD